MAKKKQVKTNAIRLLEQQKIAYVEHTYEWSEDHLDAEHVAEQMADVADRIFKTLVAIGNKTGPIVAVISGEASLDLKKIAKVSGNKKVEMLHLKDLETTTGYIRGGCSPVGMKKLFPTFIDKRVNELDTMIISAGKRGLQMELAPKDLVKVVHGTVADLTIEE